MKVFVTGVGGQLGYDVMNELPENDQVQAGDELVCYGRYKDFQKFWKAM